MIDMIYYITAWPIALERIWGASDVASYVFNHMFMPQDIQVFREMRMLLGSDCYDVELRSERLFNRSEAASRVRFRSGCVARATGQTRTRHIYIFDIF